MSISSVFSFFPQYTTPTFRQKMGWENWEVRENITLGAIATILQQVQPHLCHQEFKKQVIAQLKKWKEELKPSEENIKDLYTQIHKMSRDFQTVRELWELLILGEWILQADSQDLSAALEFFRRYTPQENTQYKQVQNFVRKYTPFVLTYIQSLLKTLIYCSGIDPRFFLEANSMFDMQQRFIGVKELLTQLVLLSILMYNSWVFIPKILKQYKIACPLWLRISLSFLSSASLTALIFYSLFKAYRLAMGVPLSIYNCRNLTSEAAEGKLKRVHGREKLIDRLAEKMMGQSGFNFWLSAQNGRGKTATMEEFAIRVQRGDWDGLKGKQVFLINAADLFVGHAYTSSLMKLQWVFEDVSTARSEAILVIDECQKLFAEANLYDLVKKYIGRREFKVIFITDRSISELRSADKSQGTVVTIDDAFRSRIQEEAEIPEPNDEEVADILESILRDQAPEFIVDRDALIYLSVATRSEEFGQPRQAVSALTTWITLQRQQLEFGTKLEATIGKIRGIDDRAHAYLNSGHLPSWEDVKKGVQDVQKLEKATVRLAEESQRIMLGYKKIRQAIAEHRHCFVHLHKEALNSCPTQLQKRFFHAFCLLNNDCRLGSVDSQLREILHWDQARMQDFVQSQKISAAHKLSS